jgi:hypothetical protein
MTNRTKQLLLHIAGCLIFLMLPLLLAPSSPTGTFNPLRNPPTLRDFIGYALLIVFFYLNYFYLIPKFYFTKKYASFTLLMLFCFAIVVVLPHLLTHPSFRPQHGMPPPMGPNDHGGPPPFNRGRFSFFFDNTQHIFLFFAVFFFSLLLRINNLWKQTEKEKLHAELSFLRAQANPHFLFNALNSIYSLSLEKSDDAPASVLKLSGMMRYVLNEATNDFVSLEDEILYVKNYIALQRVRFGDAIQLSFDIKGITENVKIAPLMLIPFVENAFKYGVNAEEHSKIDIEISCDEKNIMLYVFNNKVTVQHATNEQSGLGIGNTRKRLNLLYPSSHQLTIRDNRESFSVTLQLKRS